jgi:hypothetical protein
LLGHSSITTTLDRYGHLLPGMDEALAERMDWAFDLRVLYVEVRGFEPLTPAVRRQCSTGLSYTPGTAPG